MASFQIHEDQENRGIRRHKKEITNIFQESKRTALCNIPVQADNVLQPKEKHVKTFGEANACLKVKPTNVARKAPVKVATDSVASLVHGLKPASKVPVKASSVLNAKSAALSVVQKCQEVEKIASKLDNFISKDEESPMRVDKSIEHEVERKKYLDSLFDMEEYKHEIYSHLRRIEVARRPKAGYMKKQPDITFSMRSILVDWLVEVTEEYKMDPETLYLAVSYIDRFLSCMSVVKANLQLVGTAAMFIAAKYEEIYPPELGEFVYLTDDTYTKAQVLRMENLILKVLSFDLSVPTPLCFVKKYCLESGCSDKVKFLAMYLCELSLLEGDPYLRFLPSEIACSAVSLAKHTDGQGLWDDELEMITGYTLDEFKACLFYLENTFSKASKYPQKAVYDKYKSSKWCSVSLLTPSLLSLPRPTDVNK